MTGSHCSPSRVKQGHLLVKHGNAARFPWTAPSPRDEEEEAEAQSWVTLNFRISTRGDEGEGDVLNLGRAKMLPSSQIAGNATPGDATDPPRQWSLSLHSSSARAAEVVMHLPPSAWCLVWTL